MRFIVILLFAFISLFASDSDIKEIKQDIKIIVNKLNEIDKKVEKNSLKIEMLEKNMNQRFEDVDKRFEDMNKRFEDINKRFEDINKRFEDMNQKFDFMANILTALVAGIFGLVGFMMWDRRTLLEKAKKECDIKANKEEVENLAKAIKEVLLKDEYAREIFKKYNLL